MCGIAGAVSRDPTLRDPAIVQRMAAAIAHRGPDDEGIRSTGDCVLAARRLAIIDLAGGHQPMANEDGSVIAVQNGEIYNFEGVRSELVGLGHRFVSRNDTEVLPHAYEEWGTALVRRLRGMFALAIWDARSGTLLLARDRFGKKPLVYAESEGALFFASEIQGLLAHPAVPRGIDDEAIAEYLAFGHVPAPRTAFTAIRKLPPAHLLVFRGGRVAVERYWRLRYAPKLTIGLDEAAEELRRLIDDAVRVRLMSDVPIGAFLSGGLDSSSVVASMARQSQRVRTFSIGFADRSFDERRYARAVAQAFGTDHQELVVDAADTETLPMLVRHLGEPFADSSIVPTYQVARITRDHVTVALNGDGGDELFAGYDRYQAALVAGLADLAPHALRRAVASLAARVPPASSLPRAIGRARRFLVALGRPADARILQWMSYVGEDLRPSVYGERIDGWRPTEALEQLRRIWSASGAESAAERFIASDVETALPGDLLVKMDIATMAASLEARSPFLDHELAEFVARLPARYKLAPGRSKILLRHAMRDILPREVLSRGKMGFTAPVGRWLRGPLSELFVDLVLSDRAASRGFVRKEGAIRLWEEHRTGRADRTTLLWALLMLELWFREVVEDRAVAAGRALRSA